MSSSVHFTEPTLVSSPSVLTLPYDILYQILSYLDGRSLARFSSTCRGLDELVEGEDKLWRRLLSALQVEDPHPYPLFREMYRALHRHLFLHGRIWHSDRPYTGRVLVSRYIRSSGTIDFYQLLAKNQTGPHTPTPPPPHFTPTSNLLESEFAPLVALHKEPLISLGPDSILDEKGLIHGRRTSHEVPSPHVFLIPVKALPPNAISPSMSVWPPTIIPAEDRTRNVSLDGFPRSHRPPTTEIRLELQAETSQSLFRIRRETTIENNLRARFGIGGHFFASFHEPELVETYSAIDKALCLQGKMHPYRGIWCGDYGPHGVEIILFHQPQQHRVEAIKLVGDTNVPRGEYTFIASLDKQSDNPEWPGHKVYEAQGQIAAHRFHDPRFIQCYFIDIGPDEVAISWPDLGHVSRFRRLDMDTFAYGSGFCPWPI